MTLYRKKDRKKNKMTDSNCKFSSNIIQSLWVKENIVKVVICIYIHEIHSN